MKGFIAFLLLGLFVGCYCAEQAARLTRGQDAEDLVSMIATERRRKRMHKQPGPMEQQATICATAKEGHQLHLRCPQYMYIKAVLFASYGTPTWSLPPGRADIPQCGTLRADDDCHSSVSHQRVSSVCLGQNKCSIRAEYATFGDPCYEKDEPRHLAVEALCARSVPNPYYNTQASY
eukprot:gnl/Hemi2/18656_TR6178_c0_g1_i1.p1 gnl/Hemi2/18656_TR6178_c0_g1~~gnl/Hemi2/18656_TR6178_c0_g1_i1.p1  ORF type:complete len:177 (+),score=55.93 gnl/Hemi2/18656_TR6178_c0_g1_i1:78-608(+)